MLHVACFIFITFILLCIIFIQLKCQDKQTQKISVRSVISVKLNQNKSSYHTILRQHALIEFMVKNNEDFNFKLSNLRYIHQHFYIKTFSFPFQIIILKQNHIQNMKTISLFCYNLRKTLSTLINISRKYTICYQI